MLQHFITGHGLSGFPTDESEMVALLGQIEDMVFAEGNMAYLSNRRRVLLGGGGCYGGEEKEDD
jgi:hypothetical protein